MNETFSIVHYDDGTVEIVAGEVAKIDGLGIVKHTYKITNQFVLDYMKANNVGVRYIQTGIEHVQVIMRPRLDIHSWNSTKHIEVGEDQISNNYTEE